MGGWGTGSFENDDALDWVGGLNSLGIDDLKKIFGHAADEADYLEAPDASVVIAAAEVVAALKSAPSEKTPKEITEWAGKSENSAASELGDLAIRAVERVRRNSELKDLWLEAEGLNEWTGALQELQSRLAG